MKSLRLLICGITLLLQASCNTISSKNANPLMLTLEMDQHEISSFTDIQGYIYLLNQSDSSVLVHKRLYYFTFPIPPFIAEVQILISDSSGKLVYNDHVYPNYDLPSGDTMGVLKPNEQVARKIYHLESDGFSASMFKKGETYTIVAIYQNDLDITKTIDGVEVSSWVGSIRSNEETFVILP